MNVTVGPLQLLIKTNHCSENSTWSSQTKWPVACTDQRGDVLFNILQSISTWTVHHGCFTWNRHWFLLLEFFGLLFFIQLLCKKASHSQPLHLLKCKYIWFQLGYCVCFLFFFCSIAILYLNYQPPGTQISTWFNLRFSDSTNSWPPCLKIVSLSKTHVTDQFSPGLTLLCVHIGKVTGLYKLFSRQNSTQGKWRNKQLKKKCRLIIASVWQGIVGENKRLINDFVLFNGLSEAWENAPKWYLTDFFRELLNYWPTDVYQAPATLAHS